MAATPIIVTGEFLEPDGSPSAGSLTSSLTLPFSNGGVSYGGTRFTYFDASGRLAQALVANDDAGSAPSDSQWYCEVRVVGAPTISGYISVPSVPPGSRSVTDAVLTDGSTSLTSTTGAFDADDVGVYLFAAGLPVGCQIASVESSTAVTTTLVATESGSGESLLIGASVPLSDLLPS